MNEADTSYFLPYQEAWINDDSPLKVAEKRLQAVADAADAMRGGKVDPAKVADEIDRILGRKK